MADEKVVRVDEVEALDRLLALARQDLPPPAPEGASREAYARFRQAADHPARSTRGLWPALRRWRLPVLAAAGVLLALGTYRLAVPPPLAVVVEEGAVEEGGF